MSEELFLQKGTATPTPGVGTFGTWGTGLPRDILEEASRRLGHAALLYSGVYFLAYFGAYALIRWEPLDAFLRNFSTPVAVAAIGLGVVVYLLSRYARIPPGVLLDIGLVFEVVGAFGIAVVNVWGLFPEPGAFDTWVEAARNKALFGGIPWECVWIIVFPLIAPNTPGKVLLASVAAASMGPLGLVLSKSVGATSADVPVASLLGFYVTSTYLCAGIAVLISVGFHKYGRRLRRAREVGSYRLAERLGEGGMGEVWLARHRMLARPAAVKLIRPEALGDNDLNRHTMLRRFEREAQATAALRCCHTIELYDFGIAEDGTFYYVMELLEGLSLKALVERFGPVPAPRAVFLLRQACRSLWEAHDHGLVHRDVKPANVFACRLGPDFDFVKLLDFGLVKAKEDLRPGATELTAEGVVTGTPAFMAPELATGTAVDGRADLYALGCVGYWLLTGQPVFEQDTPLATVLHHVQSEPVRPSLRTEVDISEQLEGVILACLEKDPGRRPQNASVLEELLGDCPGADAWDRQRAREWWDLHMPPQAV